MGCEFEIREKQKEKLLGLLLIREANKELKIVHLALLITQAKIGMHKEDIADVEKEVAEFLAQS